ncbi:MAG: pentapeptide repeat-containing protein [Candidatus Brocadiae bacterium]|nr:pentapeptide repeat-containing protein [Candidatus Brocadiia bacterium]
MLMRCSEAQDISEWNQWVHDHAGEARQLEAASLRRANLQGAQLSQANLQGAYLWGANLMGATAYLAHVDGGTVISDCRVDDRTDFTGVGLASARVQPRTRAQLEYNVRRFGWRDWYKSHALLALATRPFWWVSDYGRSTCRILLVFALLSVAFAAVYWVWALVAPPGVVQNLTGAPGETVSVEVPSYVVPFRALYFSFVTMTTLGFGDMHAHPDSLAGHILLSLEVLLGYVLLGALITRFAIMFQGVAVPWDRSPPRRRRT